MRVLDVSLNELLRKIMKNHKKLALAGRTDTLSALQTWRGKEGEQHRRGRSLNVGRAWDYN